MTQAAALKDDLASLECEKKRKVKIRLLLRILLHLVQQNQVPQRMKLS